MTTAITFGRFNIIHTGHIALIQSMIDHHDNVIVGISNTAQGRRSIRWFQQRFPRATFILHVNLFSLLSSLALEETFTIFVGEDRVQMAISAQRYYTCNVTIVGRNDQAPSSTQCRNVLRDQFSAQALVDAGLAENRRHALVQIAQYTLEHQ